MATYKVIQDIESEDKLVGPFGIRQFIYLIIVVVCLFIGFRIVVAGVWFLALPLLPIVLFFGMLALPFGGEQPTETWLLAKIRFALKPRKRVWDQDGAQQLVTVTAPKKIERQLTKSMSQGEVQSRLKALANTIDSRGWAVKNVNVNVFSQPSLIGVGGDSDRLMNIAPGAQNIPGYHVTASDDMLDEQNNPTAQNLERLISASTKNHREQAIQNMRQPTPPPADDFALPTPTATPPATSWFTQQPSAPAPLPQANPAPPIPAPSTTVVAPDPGASAAASPGLPLRPLYQPTQLTEEELLDKIHANKHTPKNYGHMRVVKTLEEQEAEARAAAEEAARKAAAEAAKPAVTPTPDPDILGLANNDDLNVETIARQANKTAKQDASDDEVVISLH